MPDLKIIDGSFVADGKPIQLISGAMHYFRIHPDQWDDRLEKAAAFGLNAIETYVPWNLHEPHPGEFNFSGIADIALYLKKIQEHGLLAILRPGPYICAEWDNGGFPGWLNAIPGIELRRMNRPYLDAVERYFTELFKRIKSSLASSGGPVVMVQLENEYGSYGHDREYLKYLYDFYLANGIDGMIVTCDGAGNSYLNGGCLPGCPQFVNFGSRALDAFAIRRKYHPDEPDFCMEFWDGWFDHWGKPHHARQAGEVADEVDAMLKAGAGFNFYMFHGGTNFAFTNGANGDPSCPYAATVTSYDYDSPLSESGDPTEKFTACQQVIARHTGNPRIRPVAPSRKIAPPPVVLTSSVQLRNQLGRLGAAVRSVTPKTMEELGESFGFVYYRKHLDGPVSDVPLRLIGVNDFAQAWLGGRYLGSRFRSDGSDPFTISCPPEGTELELLVENTGRINYGPFVGKDFKGIVGSVCVELQLQFNWENRALPLNDPSMLEFGDFSDLPASFHRGYFELDEAADTFLRRPGVKGLVWINGFNLGRYWNVGPTETLYVPAPVLRRGRNEIIVLELEKLDASNVIFSAEPDLGPTV